MALKSVFICVIANSAVVLPESVYVFGTAERKKKTNCIVGQNVNIYKIRIKYINWLDFDIVLQTI